MKIAVPVKQNNQVDDHFGHCEFYNVYTLSEQNEIIDSEIIPSVQGCGCKSDIAFDLAKKGVTVMLAGGIGGGAINKLASAGIEVVRGCSGDSATLIKEYAAGFVKDSGSSCATHEQHQHGHSHEHGHSCNHK